MSNIKDKTQKDLTSIGQVASMYNIETYIIRYWEKQIDEIRPLRVNRRRFYSAKQVLLIGEIKKLIIDQGYTLKGACERFAIAKQTEQAAAKSSDPSLTWLRQLKSNVDETIDVLAD